MADISNLVDELSKLTVIETAELVKQLENKLNPNLFCKVHRSHIVNYMEIRRFSGTRGGIILMNDGTEIPVSIRRKAKFLNGLDEFAAYNRRDVHNVE